MRRILALFICFQLALACAVLCGVGSPSAADASDYSLTDLVADLEDKRAVVTIDPQPTGHPLQAPGKRFEVDGASFYVYEYADHETMEQVAATISADRGSIAVTRVEPSGVQVVSHADCIGTPYLYKRGTLIVLIFDGDPAYDHARARRMLRSLLGPHFAGGLGTAGK